MGGRREASEGKESVWVDSYVLMVPVQRHVAIAIVRRVGYAKMERVLIHVLGLIASHGATVV